MQNQDPLHPAVPCNFCKSLMFCPFCTSVLFTPCLSWGMGCLLLASRAFWRWLPWTLAHVLCHIPVTLPQALAVGHWADKCLNDWGKIFAACWEPLLCLYFLIASFISFVGKVTKTFLVTQSMNGEDRMEGPNIQDSVLGGWAHLFLSQPSEWRRSRIICGAEEGAPYDLRGVTCSTTWQQISQE